MNMPHRFKGFTLIELLISIAVIGLLSAIVLTSLRGSREQARVGSSKHFASGLDNALGGAPIAWWDFSDCSGTQLSDKSGSFRHGTLSGGMTAANWSADSPYSGQTINPCSLTFDGVANYVSVATQGSISGKFTVSAWVKPADATAVMPFISSSVPSDNGFDIRLLTGNTIYSNIGNGSATIATPSVNFGYETGRWYNIAVVVTPTGYTIYADGQVKGQGTYAADVPLLYDSSSHNLTIGMGGNIHAVNKYFKGNIASVHIFGLALTDAEVHQLYAEEKGAFDSVAVGNFK